MDVPALSMAMAQQLATNVNMAVMKMSLENMEQVETQLAEMIEGATIDVSV